MTKAELLLKLQEIKQSTETIMKGGVVDEQTTGNVTED